MVNPTLSHSGLKYDTIKTKERLITTIIFDLGGVIIDLDVAATTQALSKLISKNAEELSGFYESPDFLAYEKGLVSDEEFRASIRKLTPNKITNQQIDDAWNAMLLGLPAERMELVTKLSPQHNLLVLSNTNGIHVKRFNKFLKTNTGKNDLNSFFDVVYFSHEIKMRKPDAEIYQFVLEENNLNPEDTLFLDDNKTNLEAAEKLGIQTTHIDHPNRLFEIF